MCWEMSLWNKQHILNIVLHGCSNFPKTFIIYISYKCKINSKLSLTCQKPMIRPPVPKIRPCVQNLCEIRVAAHHAAQWENGARCRRSLRAFLQHRSALWHTTRRGAQWENRAHGRPSLRARLPPGSDSRASIRIWKNLGYFCNFIGAFSEIKIITACQHDSADAIF